MAQNDKGSDTNSSIDQQYYLVYYNLNFSSDNFDAEEIIIPVSKEQFDVYYGDNGFGYDSREDHEGK